MDQIIRQKFENFAPVPPESVWLNVKDKIGGQAGGAPSGNHIIMPVITILTVIIALIVALFNYQTDIGVNTAQSFDNEPVYYAVAGFSSDLGFQHQQQDIHGPAAPEPIITPSEALDNAARKAPIEAPVITPDAGVAASANAAIETTTIMNASPEQNSAPGSGQDAEDARIDENIHMPAYSLTGNIELGRDENETTLPYKPASLKTAYDDYYNDHRPGWSFGLFFSPEVVFYQDDSLANNRSYGIDVSAYYNFSDYFFQSGLGVKFAHDRSNYLIDYNEYLGSYDHVYQVTFDSTSQGIIPTYHTYNVDVYDSVNHSAVTETKVRYAYFEIPLLFGYSKQVKNFNFYLAGGPNFSFLFNTKVEDASYPEDQIRIVNIEQQAPTRLDLNWQLVFRAGLGYKLGDNFSIMLEPTFKYYMKSEYDLMNSAAKPYSFGVRAGLIYHLSK